jgi:7-cyano-7-deazaguanine synthase
MSTQVLLYSGGMDSFITAHAFPLARLVYIDTRARYAAKELAHVHETAPRGVLIDSRLDLSTNERDDLIVPARNLLLVTLATHYGSDILLAATAGDRSTDKDLVFADQASKLLTHIYDSHHFPEFGQVSVRLPYRDKSKGQMVAEYLEAGHSAEKLANTISCYDPRILHCGRCKACIRKWVALKIHEIDHLTPWQENPKYYNWLPILDQIAAGGWRCPQEDADLLKALGRG